ncbi:MAG: hypothetical protein A2270_10425 [Elusimicrobia bacterium RIFOXYA12_FULL_51_18]|nr:MAG: hypothetical protein A2270_10425 [Elusimicrobia bacterium RIFOXYA12_FULL_51_18]OGS29520.1 MAG: hypothetical protein A2218_00765 [Elusimicrobia bacterium RIFOXYA2_FULL_53_38]
MKANEAKVGEKYLSKTGIPVTMTGSKAGKVLIKLETTGTTIMVNGDYELKPYDEKGIGKESKLLLKVNGKGKTGGGAKAKNGGSLAAIIDPYLLSGGKTTQEIAAEVAKKAGDAGKGKDLEANVRARCWTFKKKGWQVVKDDKKRVKVFQKKG